MNRYLSVRRTIAPPVLATMVAAGATLTWVVAITLVMNRVPLVRLTAEPPVERLVFTVEGEPLLLTSQPSAVPVTQRHRAPDGSQRVTRGYSIDTYRTLSGQIIEWPITLQSGGSQQLPPAKRDDDWRPRGLEIRGFLAAEPPAYWYLLLDGQAGRAHFAGFDPQSKRAIGYLGLRGYRVQVPPAADRFDLPGGLYGALAPNPGFANEPDFIGSYAGRGDTEDIQFLVSGKTIQAVDVNAQTVRPVQLPDKVISVGVMTHPVLSEDKQRVTYPRKSVARLPDKLVVLEPGGKPSRTFSLPLPVRERAIEFLGTLGEETVLVARQENPQSEEELPTLIYWFNDQGDVVRQAQAELAEQSAARVLWIGAATLPVPLLYANFVGRKGSQRGLAFLEDWPPMLAVCLASAAGAGVCFRRQRSIGSLSSAWAWAALVFALGPAGLLGYWTQNHRPVCERCEHCGAVVPRNRETCRACAAAFPPPALKGSEVFA